MKSFSIASLGTLALLGVVPFVGGIVGVPSVWDVGTAIAQNINTQPQLQLRLEAEKKIANSWQPLQGQAVVKPGDELRYILSGENQSDRPVKNLTLNQPIPKGMVYVLKSAKANTATKITYSIDGGNNFVENPTVKVKLANGKEEIRPASASAYTHIRLYVPSVAAKATVKATYQTQVR